MMTFMIQWLTEKQQIISDLIAWIVDDANGNYRPAARLPADAEVYWLACLLYSVILTIYPEE